ncbi:MAG: HDIG domain-containing protein [Lentisphaerae bacterium]|nr:HDIG domain-containing protein [Lentisphaerota bacterium]
MNSLLKNRTATIKVPKQNFSEKKNGKLPKFRKLEKKHYSAIAVLLILMCASVWSIMSRMDYQDVPHLVPDQISSTTIYAAIPFLYKDEEETKALHQETLSRQPLFFRIEQKKMNALKSELGRFKSILQGKGEKYNNSLLYDSFSKQMTEAALKGIIKPADQEKYRKNNYRLVDHHGRCAVERKDILDASRPQEEAKMIAKNIIYDFFKDEDKDFKQEAETFFKEHAEKLLTDCCMEYDKPYTEKEHNRAVKEVGVVQYEYARGDLLLRKGATVTQQDIQRLKFYKSELEKIRLERNPKTDWSRLSQSICIAFLLILFTAIYITHIHPEIIESGSKMCALGVIVLTALLLNILFVKLFSYASEMFSIPPRLWYLALPIGFAPIVICTLIGVRVALFSGLFIALVASFSGLNQFNMVVYGMVVSALASYMIRNCLNYRSLFLRGFFTLSIVSTVLAVIFCWRDNVLAEMLPWPFIIPVIISVITIVLVQFSLIILETIFDLASKISLNLYSDYNHPLLKEMQLNAPGTYHHSLIVSMLAEAAAEAIGADPVRARVGALFHDVGKTMQSEYFTENSNGENMHASLTPQESALVITNHIREGIKRAKEYKLKRPIREAIEQHHGTDLVYYFYKQAKDNGACINEADFRYSGPKPQSKEIAILSLADACEAASRSLDKPSQEQISEMVNAIIQKRLKEGQLDDCALTFRELSMIRDSFVKTLTSMLHARIAYPKDEEEKDEDDLFMDVKG